MRNSQQADDKAQTRKKAKDRDEQRMMEKYDVNKNGILDPEEKTAMEKDKKALLKQYDANGDRKLDKPEKENHKRAVKNRKVQEEQK